MSKGKDPAFLFYSKDWIEGTAEFMPDEKGIYIDLLCYQHQHGSIPADTMRLARIVGISAEEFNRLWAAVSDKFKQEGNRLVNRRLREVMDDRAYNAHINRINGTFAGLLRMGKFTSEEYAKLKKEFNNKDFLDVSPDEISTAMSGWITDRLPERSKSIGNGNGIGNAFQDEDVIINEGENFSFQDNSNIEEMPF